VRVLYSFPDAVGKPGIGWVAYHHVRELIAQGVEVDPLCTSMHPGFEIDGGRRLVTTMALKRRRVPHRAIGVGRAHQYHDWRVAKALEEVADEVDLVHCWPRAVLRTAAVARRLGVPIVREVPNTHTAFAFEVVGRERERLRLPLAKNQTHAFNAGVLALEEAEYDAADLLLVPSELAERTFVERGVPAEKLAVHGYGFEPELFPPGPEPPAGGQPLTALFAARCEPRKGLHHALTAWHDSGLAETGRLIVCGEFVSGYRQVVEPLLSHESVEWRGFVSDLGATMRESNLFILPSIEEGSALVTYGAQGSGCVLVVSDAAGARCQHLHDGLVHEAGDIATLTDHLRLLDSDRGLLARLRGESLKTAQRLTWRNAAEELIQRYEDLLLRHRGAGRAA
jgi:glycosyltransferase involved in cell wall biosynthesis